MPPTRTTVVRKITKPVAASLVVRDAEGEIVPDSAYELDPTTGVLTYPVS